MEKQVKQIRNKVLAVSAALLLLVLILTLSRSYILDKQVSIDTSQQKSNTVTQKPERGSVEIKKSKTEETKLNFQQINFDISSILNDPIVQDLPKSASIELIIGETSYTLSKDSVNVGKPSNPDLTISVPSQYLSQISLGLCEVIKKANADKTLVVQTHTSQTALLWKYKGMLKYKECLS